jgi:hypothetical protein
VEGADHPVAEGEVAVAEAGKNKHMKNEFFGSKLNTALLLVLIVLMVVAIWVMFPNRELYLHPFSQNQEQTAIVGISGNKEDLVSFSILPGSKVHGVVSYRGVIKGGYFFEGNILIGVADVSGKIILQSNAVAKTDWATSGPVSFEGNLDFSKLQKGSAFIEIHNDNASGLPENDKLVLIPIIIE